MIEFQLILSDVIHFALITRFSILECSLACNFRGTLDKKKCSCKCPSYSHIENVKGQCVRKL